MTRKYKTSTNSVGDSYFADAATREVVSSNTPSLVVPAVPVPAAPAAVTPASTSSTAPSGVAADKSSDPYIRSGHKVVIKTYAVKRG